jgi:signal transduction histidine kinase
VLIEPLAGEVVTDRLARCERVFAMGNLAPHLVHEINNALAIASIQMQVMMQDLPANEPRRASLQVVVDEAARIGRIATNVLTHAKLPPPSQRPVDISELVNGVLALQRYQMKTENVDLVVDLPANPPSVQADEGRLRQVFLNLVINARQAMPQGGRIEVSARETDGCFEVNVADTGPGIAAENLERIFEPYFTTRPAEGGTGLGLAVSRDYVERMGGTLTVRSQLGQGACFTVRLPVQR